MKKTLKACQRCGKADSRKSIYAKYCSDCRPKRLEQHPYIYIPKTTYKPIKNKNLSQWGVSYSSLSHAGIYPQPEMLEKHSYIKPKKLTNNDGICSICGNPKSYGAGEMCKSCYRNNSIKNYENEIRKRLSFK